MKSFRKVLFWLHLISGVVAGIVIFIMCVTGALLSFEKNITEYAEREARYVSVPQDAPRLPVAVVINKVRAARPDAKISGITQLNDSTAALQFALGRDGQIFANPYTGEISGESSKGWHSFFGIVEDLHRWIAFPGGGRPVGKAMTGISNLIFLFLAISGIYIWFPRRRSWKHFRAAMVFRWKVKGKARDFNWHTVIGFWSSLVLIVLTVTAAVISYQWAGNLLYTLTGNEIPPQQQRPGPPPNAPGQQPEQPFVVPENLDAMWKQAVAQPNWKSVSLRLPLTNDAATFTIDEGIYWNIFGRSTLTVNAKTAEVSKWESYGEQNSARQLRSWFRFTHTGESGGLVGQLIGFLACLGGAVLTYTGFALAWRRFRNWRSKAVTASS